MQSPIIIIGAGRSGTKVLRNMICTHPDLVTWPCDEINPIWRYGHANYPTDELEPEHATEKVKDYIRSQFGYILDKYNGSRVVEKTCANSLRVEYVYEIFPNAQFIHLIRDGRDVAESARRRWTGDVELSYILKKGRWIPFSELPYYIYHFFTNRIKRLLDERDQLKTWGPRFEGIDELAKSKSLIEVCGIQWRQSVTAARRGFEEIPSSQVFNIHYETLAQSPVESFSELFRFLDLELGDDLKLEVENTVTDENIGKGVRKLSKEELEKLMPHIEATLREEGYLE